MESVDSTDARTACSGCSRGRSATGCWWGTRTRLERGGKRALATHHAPAHTAAVPLPLSSGMERATRAAVPFIFCLWARVRRRASKFRPPGHVAARDGERCRAPHPLSLATAAVVSGRPRMLPADGTEAHLRSTELSLALSPSPEDMSRHGQVGGGCDGYCVTGQAGCSQKVCGEPGLGRRVPAGYRSADSAAALMAARSIEVSVRHAPHHRTMPFGSRLRRVGSQTSDSRRGWSVCQLTTRPGSPCC